MDFRGYQCIGVELDMDHQNRQELDTMVEGDNFYIKKSPLGGNGVFAKIDILKGSLIKTLSGEIVTEQQCLEAISDGQENYDDPLQIEEGDTAMDRKYIDLDELSRTFNHSCGPNAGIRNVSDLIAMEDIRVGEEITFDYSTTVGRAEILFAMECHCGSDNCRGIVGNIDTIPEADSSKYLAMDLLPAYIKKQVGG
jgi:hypothetical protein